MNGNRVRDIRHVILAFVVLVGLAAAFIPSRRAARTDPLTALRHE